MINDTTHNFNPEHFDEGLYQEFRRSNYFKYTKFLEDRARELEQSNRSLRREVKKVTDELDETK